MYGEMTNPQPYIQASYAIGFALIFGYSFWLIASRKRVQRHLRALREENPK